MEKFAGILNSLSQRRRKHNRASTDALALWFQEVLHSHSASGEVPPSSRKGQRLKNAYLTLRLTCFLLRLTPFETRVPFGSKAKPQLCSATRSRRRGLRPNTLAKCPNLDLPQYVFLLKNNLGDESIKTKLLDVIRSDKMLPYYLHVCETLDMTLDAELVKTLEEDNAKELAKLEEKLKDAEGNHGATEISEVLYSKAIFFTRIGDKQEALNALQLAYDKTGPLGYRIDIMFTSIRLGFFFGDNELITRDIDKAKTLIDDGGDWDCRNRLKVYEGVYLISIREFKKAVDLFLDTLATFTCTEFMEYEAFVKYTVLTAAITLKRSEFKSKIVTSSEVLESLINQPNFLDFIQSFHNCDYIKFFECLAEIEQILKRDRLLSPHYRYYVSEMKIIVYLQLLQSYRSINLESMANSFGVTVEWIDSDLSKYIAAGRINAMIDRVKHVIEISRPDEKNAKYHAALKHGDIMLNQIQNLSRVINI